MPHNYFSLGASGAVFGLFAVSGALPVPPALSPNWRAVLLDWYAACMEHCIRSGSGLQAVTELGLCERAVLLKLRFNFRKLVECLVLGQFVVNQIIHVRPRCSRYVHGFACGWC